MLYSTNTIAAFFVNWQDKWHSNGSTYENETNQLHCISDSLTCKAAISAILRFEHYSKAGYSDSQNIKREELF
jgi:hypothetical protein